MPRDSNGVYTLPAGYLAVNAETILVTQHNPPLEDIETALTGSLPRNGTAAMTGALRLDDGTSGAPALTFASATSVGLYKTTSGKMAMTGVLGAMPAGAVIDFAGPTAPDGWLFCYGQSLLRADFPELFAAIGTAHGAVDATHFSLPDCRGTVTAGKNNMGGTDRGILTGGHLIGALLGEQSEVIAQANLPSYTLPDTIGISDTRTWGWNRNALNNVAGGGTDGATGQSAGAFEVPVTVTSGSISKTGSVTSGGSGTALSVVQPTIIFNKIIFTGV